MEILSNYLSKLFLTAIFGLCVYFGFVLLKQIVSIWRCRRQANKLPGLKQLPIIGDLHHIPFPIDHRFNKFVRFLTDKYKYAIHFNVSPFRAAVSILHPRPLKAVLKGTEPKDTAFGGIYGMIHNWIGKGLLTSAGAQWHRNRKLITPAFHFEILKPYTTIYNECVDTLLDKWLPHAEGKETVEIYGDLSKCTLNVIMRCAFSYPEDVQNVGDTHPYVKAVSRLTDLAVRRFFRPWFHVDWIYNLTSDGRECKHHCDYVHRIADEIIAKRKLDLAEQTLPKNSRLDFLDILLSAKDENGVGLTDDEIRQEVDTFLFEGHDTTASGLSWIIYLLAKHPEHQELCREEIDKLLLNRGSNPQIEWDDFNNMPYLTRCIKEGLRMYPPVPSIGRHLLNPLEIEGVTLLPNTCLILGIYAVHHNPLVWGDNHMDYEPDRFLPENIESMDPHAFCPFAAGPRNCIGQNFAMNEIKTLVAKLLNRYELSIDPEAPEPEDVQHIVMRSLTGIHVRLTLR